MDRHTDRIAELAGRIHAYATELGPRPPSHPDARALSRELCRDAAKLCAISDRLRDHDWATRHCSEARRACRNTRVDSGDPDWDRTHIPCATWRVR